MNESVTNNTILLPCPFCGGEAYYRTPEHHKGTAFDIMRIECKRCGATPYAIEIYEFNKEEDKRAAIARLWNRRYNDKKYK